MDINNLTSVEKKHFEKLIASAERNKTEAQQLALDAGKILTITSDRLGEYKHKGFFKRCWYSISGKHGELRDANQNDLIEMQKYAWHYLMKLQDQNLIQAQAIAVIRNNLKDIVETESKIITAIDKLVEKFDKRITKVEEITSIHDWILGSEIKQYSKNYKYIRLLQIIFDYFSILQKNQITYNRIEFREDLNKVFKKWNLNFEEKVTLNEFVIQLFEDINSFGTEEFLKLLKIKVDDNQISTDFILNNVSGSGYNTLYSIEKQLFYTRNMVQQIKNGDERKELLLKTLQSVIVNPDTSYSLSELSYEILAGTMLAEQIYREQNEIESEPQTQSNDEFKEFSVESTLLGDFIPIHYHALLETSPSNLDKLTYLESFSLIFATSGNISSIQKNYISALNTLFDCEKCIDRIEFLIANPIKINTKDIITLLNTQAKQYAWLVDAIFLSCADGTLDSKAKEVILQMSKTLNFKVNEFNPFMESIEKFALEVEPSILLDLIRSINYKTNAWQTVLDFRKISLKGAFDELKNNIILMDFKLMRLSLEIGTSSLKPSDCFAFGDENIIQRGIISLSRSSCISEFKNHKIEAEKIEDSSRDLIKKANQIVSMFGSNTFHNKIQLFDIDADETTSISNENWVENMNVAFNKLSNFVDEISNILELLREQLELYEVGDYYLSAVELRKLKKRESDTKQKNENEEKRVVKLKDGNSEITISIKWENLKQLPFDTEDIKGIASNENKWLIITDKLYESKDGYNWTENFAPNDISKMNLKYLNSYWLIWNKYSNSYYYSKDGNKWLNVILPETIGYIIDIVFLEDTWLFQTTSDKSYSYVEEGIIFDSNETSTYDSSELYITKKISGNLELWEEGSKLQEGVFISEGSIYGNAEIKMAICSYDYSFCENTKLKTVSAYLAYSKKNKPWKRAYCSSEYFGNELEVKGQFISFKDHILLFTNKVILKSTDGISWEKLEQDISGYGDKIDIIDNLLCKYNAGYSPKLHLSSDGLTYEELFIDKPMEFFSAKGDTILIGSSRLGGSLRIGKLVVK